MTEKKTLTINSGTAQTAGVAIVAGAAGAVATTLLFSAAFRVPKAMKKYLPKKDESNSTK